MFLLDSKLNLIRNEFFLLPFRMIVIQKVVTDEGEEIPFQLTDLECGTEVDGENDRVFLLWPVTIGHKVRFLGYVLGS